MKCGGELGAPSPCGVKYLCKTLHSALRVHGSASADLTHSGECSCISFIGGKKKKSEFPLWLSRPRTSHSVHEDVGSIPGLSQWVKDPMLP